MKLNRFLYSLLIMILLSGSNHLVLAHGDDDHSHDGPSVISPPAGNTHFSTEAASEKYEVLLRYAPITPGEKTSMTLFVSDFISNKPVNEASLKLTIQGDPSTLFSVHPHGAGTYKVEAVFTEKKQYSLIVEIDGVLGADLLLLQNIDVGRELGHTDEGEQASSGFFTNGNWLYLLLAMIAGVVIGLLFRKRNTVPGRSTMTVLLVIIACSIPFQTTIAHGDDDHTSPATGPAFSGHVYVPKETQFLFDIHTQKTAKGSFTQSTKLFGTIIPSSEGQSIITVPQNGIVRSVQVSVGQKVKEGQVLAIVEQSVDAGTKVSMLAELNSLEAEYAAATKEVNRLNAVKDIAAKKDIDEAQARHQKAESNLKLFKSATGKTIVLKAPIQGVLGNFTVTSGTTVNAAEALFTITNLNTLYVEAQVFDRDAGKIVPHATYTIECANDCHKTSQIKLLSYAQEINTTNQSQRVLFEVDNPDGDFKIGEFVNIRVFDAAPSQEVTVLNSAITEINGKPVVFIKESAEEYAPAYVQPGDNNGTYTTIIKGLTEGGRVVINGSYQMKMIYLNQ